MTFARKAFLVQGGMLIIPVGKVPTTAETLEIERCQRVFIS
ncbi:hypothetical protein GFC30_1321 [Anoxybacillus amylolyticus]|uniref:Uncharacterized protein n=1 Tax=Anoxybacteroides amylolyticum TaxID=294699 RepID=A0A160F2W7_9BACL|nr:hypothetical protein GFC30_1321 [Anoxybacillus amylolyticus]